MVRPSGRASWLSWRLERSTQPSKRPRSPLNRRQTSGRAHGLRRPHRPAPIGAAQRDLRHRRPRAPAHPRGRLASGPHGGAGEETSTRGAPQQTADRPTARQLPAPGCPPLRRRPPVRNRSNTLWRGCGRICAAGMGWGWRCAEDRMASCPAPTRRPQCHASTPNADALASAAPVACTGCRARPLCASTARHCECGRAISLRRAAAATRKRPCSKRRP